MHPLSDKNWKVWLTTNLKRFTNILQLFAWSWRGQERGVLDQIFPDATTATIYITTNLSWKKLWEQNHSYTFTPCQEPALTTGHPKPLLLVSCHPSIQPSFLLSFFTVSRVGGTRRQGEECSVLSQSFACTSVPKTTRERRKKM